MSKSLPPSRRVRGQVSSTNRISKSVATSTETLPQRRPDPPVENERPPQSRRDPPVENGGLESRSAMSGTEAEIMYHLREIVTMLEHGNKLKERELDLLHQRSKYTYVILTLCTP